MVFALWSWLSWNQNKSKKNWSKINTSIHCKLKKNLVLNVLTPYLQLQIFGWILFLKYTLSYKNTHYMIFNFTKIRRKPIENIFSQKHLKLITSKSVKNLSYNVSKFSFLLIFFLLYMTQKRELIIFQNKLPNIFKFHF